MGDGRGMKWNGREGKGGEGREKARGKGGEGGGRGMKGRGCRGARKVVCPRARAGFRRAWQGGYEKNPAF